VLADPGMMANVFCAHERSLYVHEHAAIVCLHACNSLTGLPAQHTCLVGGQRSCQGEMLLLLLLLMHDRGGFQKVHRLRGPPRILRKVHGHQLLLRVEGRERKQKSSDVKIVED